MRRKTTPLCGSSYQQSRAGGFLALRSLSLLTSGNLFCVWVELYHPNRLCLSACILQGAVRLKIDYNLSYLPVGLSRAYHLGYADIAGILKGYPITGITCLYFCNSPLTAISRITWLSISSGNCKRSSNSPNACLSVLTTIFLMILL